MTSASAGALSFGPSSDSSHASQDEAVELLLARRYSACQTEFGRVKHGGSKRRVPIGMLNHSAEIVAACGGHQSKPRLHS